MNEIWLYISIGASLLSIGVALYLFYWVKQQPPGSERAQEVASWIREGSQTYLKRLYITLTIVAVILGFIIAIVFSFDLSDVTKGEVSITPLNGVQMALSFIVGALCSAVAGYMGMGVAVEANVRTATAAKDSINKAFRLSFYAGSVMGLAMVGLAVLGMSLIFLLTGRR
jgi:K(+)-stimulated pyrophosphate-energized sodium pump